MTSRPSRNRFENARRINLFGTMVLPCNRCNRLNLECRLLAGYRKCRNYIRAGLSYNAATDNLGALEKVDREKKRIEKEIEKIEAIRRENDARFARFRTLQKSLREREIALVVKGANTLDELDRIEEEERRASSSRDVPFDPITGFEDLGTELSEAQ